MLLSMIPPNHLRSHIYLSICTMKHILNSFSQTPWIITRISAFMVNGLAVPPFLLMLQIYSVTDWNIWHPRGWFMLRCWRTLEKWVGKISNVVKSCTSPGVARGRVVVCRLWCDPHSWCKPKMAVGNKINMRDMRFTIAKIGQLGRYR